MTPGRAHFAEPLTGSTEGTGGVLRRIELGRHVRFLRADIERLVGEQDDSGVA